MNKFSKYDITELMKLSKEGTPLFEYLSEFGCTNQALKDLLLKLPNQIEYKYVFELPLKDVPKTLQDPRIHGYCLWRWSIGK